MIKTTIFDATGLSISLELRRELTVEQVKAQALSELASHYANMKHSQHYKLVSSKSGRSLNDSNRLKDEVVYSNDELLLLRRNHPTEAGCSSLSSRVERIFGRVASDDEERFRAPSWSEILEATECVPPKDIDRPNAKLPPKGEHRNEIRKIMVTLVEYSEVMLRDHPDVKPIFKNLEEKLSAPQYSVGEPSVDPFLIKKMTDMGFEQHLAERALIAKNSCPAAALELLLSGDHNVLLSAEPSSSKPTKIPKAYAMLQCFQEYRHKMYRTNQKAVDNLKDMGFSEPDVLDALRIHSNNQEAACNWLLSDRRPMYDFHETGLDPDGVIYKAIIANPVIQLGLCTPKVLMALLQILENPHCVNRWINDADTTALLSHLFRIYHSEKTSLHVQ